MTKSGRVRFIGSKAKRSLLLLYALTDCIGFHRKEKAKKQLPSVRELMVDHVAEEDAEPQVQEELSSDEV